MGENSTDSSAELVSWAYEAIPFDIFVSKQYNHLGFRGALKFIDSEGNLVYRVLKLDGGSSNFKKKLLLDSSGNTIVSLDRINNEGSWRGYKGSNLEQLFLTVERKVNEFNRCEFKILLKNEDSNSDIELQMKGSPLKRACTIYKLDSIVAQTSLMYRIGVDKMFVPRSRFRVTIFPSFTDPFLVAALIVVYFDGRKLWI